MIATPFTYLAPASLAEAVALFAENPSDTKVLGGGTWLVPDMNRGLIAPGRVLDLRHAGLAQIGCDGDTVTLGAMVTYADVLASPVLGEHGALLQTMAAGITGGRQLTQQATIGGSAVAARPQSDVPAALVALGATALLAGPDGERRLAVTSLFTGPMTTALARGELLAGFAFASTRALSHGYVKLKRGASSWPIATAAIVAGRDGSGCCTSVSLALGGVAGMPVAVALDGELVGQVPTAALIAAAATTASAAVLDPWGDALAPAAYRRAVAAPVAQRALAQALLTNNGSN